MKSRIIHELSQLTETIKFITESENLYDETSIEKTTHLFNHFFDKKSIVINIYKEDIIIASSTLTFHPEIKEGVFLGFYEVPKDTQDRDDVVKELFNLIDQECSKRNISNIFGPIKFTTWLGNRFKLQGTDKSFSWEPSENNLYVQDFKAFGFVEDKQYISNFYNTNQEILKNTKDHHKACIEQGYIFDDISIGEENYQKQLFELNSICFSGNYLYTPATFEQYKNTHLAALKGFDFTYSSYITKEGVAQGYIFCFIDQGELVIKTILISPTARNAGLASAMVHEIIKRADDNGISKGIGALVRKGNISEFFFKSLASPTFQHSYSLFKKVIK